MSVPELYVRRVGEGPAVVLLHGLFGSGANLGALSRSLRGAYTVYSPDLPGHGRSAWLGTLDLPGMAAALRRWMDEEGLARAHLVGHSLGGKVAMECALGEPGRVASLVVADVAPVAYPARHDGVFTALAAVADGHCADRATAAALLGRHLRDAGTIEFLLASLQRGAAGDMEWRFDRKGIEAAYTALLAAPAAGLLYPGPVLFIRGGESDYIHAEHWPLITGLFPAATVEDMPGCGHWLHVEQPAVFNGMVRRFLDREEQPVPGAGRLAGTDAS